MANWTWLGVAGAALAVTAIGVVSAAVMMLAYGLLGLLFKRRHRATRTSRMAAGVASGVAMGLAMRFYFWIEFNGPPGVFTVPTAAIAALVADRLVAKLTRSPAS
jgi:Na+/proline symporter